MKSYRPEIPHILETPRCFLRLPGPEHATDLLAVYGHGETMEFMQRPPASSIVECLDMIEGWEEEFTSNISFRWGIFLRDDPGHLVGTAALHYWSPANETVELGADLHRDLWGRGVITEITSRLIQCAFQDLKVNRLELRCDPDNIGSVVIARKFGFTFEGTLREYVLVPGKGFVNESIYSLLRREWNGMGSRK